ncbi:MAG: hypothetical protein HYR88_00635 [Verrucomicrobia bacterium]|nr:hypothetical protein [Verrucomicrobiota bacterium]MBI3871013.1 hypothetical protein [Verrucomicrobiota bacterium]
MNPATTQITRQSSFRDRKQTSLCAGARRFLLRRTQVLILLATVSTILPLGSLPAFATDLVWTNKSGGSWSVAANWSPNLSPSAGDAVWITNNGTYTVSLDVAATLGGLALGGTTGTQTLSHVSGATLTLNGPASSSTQGVYALGGGSLQGTGPMTLMGPFRWTAGTIVGLAATPMIIAANGGFAVSGPSSKTVTSAQIANGKSGSWSGGLVWFNGNSSFSNALNATFDLVGDGNSFLLNLGSPWIANLGTLRKTTGAGRTILSVPVGNSGTVEVNAGVLALTVADSAGQFTPGAGATLSMDGAATFSDTASISGPGHFTLSGATLTNNGVFNVAGTNLFASGVAILNGATFITNAPLVVSGATLSLNGSGVILASSVSLSSGNLLGSLPIGVSGAFFWSGGSFGNAASSLAMTVDGGITALGGSKLFYGGMIVNRGLATWNAGQILFKGSAVFSNAPGSILDLPQDGPALSLVGGSPLLANSGTIRKSAGKGKTTFSVALENSGRVEALSGTLELNGGGASRGEFFADLGATLLFDGGEPALLPASKLDGPGAVTIAAAVSIQGETAIGSLTNSSQLSLGASETRFVTNFTMSMGVLSGGGTLRIPGSFRWSSGAIGNGVSAPLVIAEGGTTFDGSSKVLNGATLINTGLATWLAGQVTFSGASTLSNAPNGVIDFQADGSAFALGAGSPQFLNAGLLKKTGGLGVAVVSVSCGNAGSVAVNSGTLALTLDDSTGVFTIPAASTLSVNGTATLSSTASITGSGNFEMTSGAMTNKGLFSVSGTNTFRGGVAVVSGNCVVNGGAMVVTGGTVLWKGVGVVAPDSLSLSLGLLDGSMGLSVSGPFNWPGGAIGTAGSSLVLSTQGKTTLSGSTKLCNGGTFINRGLLTWLSGQVIFNGTAVFSNAPSGIVELQGEGNSFLLNNGPSLLLNAGLLRKVGGVGAAIVSLPLNNSGVVESDAGTLAVVIGDSSGSFIPNAGATLSVAGPAVLSSSASVTGSGVMMFNGGAITHNGLWNITGTNVVSQGGVAMNGTCIMTNPALVVNGGTLTLNGNGLIAPLSVRLSSGGLSSSLPISAPGSFTWTGGTLGSAAGTTTLTSGGTLSIEGAASRSFQGGMLINAGVGAWTGGLVFFNNGAVLSNAPSGTLDIQGDGNAFLLITGPSVLANGGLLRRSSGAGTGQISIPCYNSGTVQVSSGVLGFGAGYLQSGGQTLMSGGSLNFGQTAAQLIGGSIGGNGTVTGSVSNNATVNPGASPGLLSITGNYSEGPGARLRIELAGTTAGVTYDQLSVGGKAKLAGVLEVSYLNGFVPAPGNVFTALVCGARSGGFSRLETPTNAMGTIYTPKSVLVETGNASPGAQLLVEAAPIVCRTFSLRATAADPDGSITNLAILLDSATLASTSGGAVEVTFSTDAPGPLSFTAIATDNKGAQGTTNIVVDVSTLPPLVLDAVGFQTNRAFKLCMSGEPGKSYNVEGNEDLGGSAWPTLGAMVSSNGILQFLDTTATNAAHRTYRARATP